MTMPLRRDRHFVRYWAARTISLAGSATSLVLLPVLVYDRTRSAALTGALSAAQFGPYLLFGLTAGAVADRVDRRRVMVGAEVASALLLATVPLAAALGVLSTAHVLIVAFLVGCLYVWFDAANFGALPHLVGRSRLPEAVGAVGLSSTVADVAGPALAGILLAVVTPAVALLTNAGSFLLSAALLLAVPLGLAGRRPPDSTPLRADVADGVRFLWDHALIRSMTLLAAGLGLTTGTVLGLLVVYGTQGLGLAPRDPRISLLYTAVAVGGLLAALVAPRLARSAAAGRAMLAALAANLAGLLGLAAARSLPVALVLLVVVQAAYVGFTLITITVRQQLTPDGLSSRVNTTARMLAVGAQPLGALVGGLLVGAVGVRETMLVMAAGVLGSAVLGWLSPVRRPLVRS
jgi:MFS family permease